MFTDMHYMHCKVNWDLSGRFYHYMGMYAPPVGGEEDGVDGVGGGLPRCWLNRWNPFST